MFLLLVGQITAQEFETLFVFEMIRHGARSVESRFSTFTPPGYFGPGVGNGEITDTGRIQHMSIGHQRRREYVKEKGFLSEKYDPSEILSMSTFKQRCAVSGEYFLRGLYPLQDICFNQEVNHLES